MKRKMFVAMLIVLGIAFFSQGCATNPKDYKGTITADVASTEIGNATTSGIVGAVLGVFAGFYTLGAYQNPPLDEYGDEDLTNAMYGALITSGCFIVSSVSFKAAREWESEIGKIDRKTGSLWPFEKSFAISQDTSLSIGYNFPDFNAYQMKPQDGSTNGMFFNLSKRF